MEAQSVCKTNVEIRNPLGLHARPAMMLVDLANQHESAITIRKEGQAVDGKSIMQVMMLAAAQGAQLEIEAHGADSEQAVKQMRNLIERQFDEA